MSTIGTLVNHGITLGTLTQNGTYASPLTITSYGYIDNSGTGAAIYGPNTAAWYVDNQGTVAAANGSGISLKAGGTVINSGRISGAGINTHVGPFYAGVYIGGAPGLVVNSGTISGPNGVDLYAGGTVVNSGLISNPGTGAALFMDQPGYVSIAAGGTVSGGIGVEIANPFQAIGPSLVINSGLVIGSLYVSNPGRYFGVYIGSGGTLVNNAGGTISGMVFANRGPLTVIDYGTITSPKGNAIYLYGGGSVTIGDFNSGAAGSAGANGPAPPGALVNSDIDAKQSGAAVNVGSNGIVQGGINFANPGALNNQGLITGGASAGVKMDQGGRMSNQGQIGNLGQLIGVYALVGGVETLDFTNDPLGSILMGFCGVEAFGGIPYSRASAAITNSSTANATITNLGTMVGTTGFGIYLYGTGGAAIITNGSAGATTALIAGGTAGIHVVAGNVATITDFGTIVGAGSAGVGVLLASGSTLTNAGTIIGQGGTAVYFAAGNYANRLVVDPGAYFGGAVAGGGGVLELAVGSGSAGTLSGLGPTVANFSTLQFDGGAHWTVEGSAAGLAEIVTGFAVGDTIDVDGFVAVSDTYTGSALVLTDSGNNQVTLDIEGGYTTSDFVIASDNHGGTDVTTIACYARGTLIRTNRGEVPVEELAIGDAVVTISGKAKPIKWIGRRAYAGRFVAGNRGMLNRAGFVGGSNS